MLQVSIRLCRVLALERLRLSDLTEMNALQQRLNEEIDTALMLREELAEAKLQALVSQPEEEGCA